jgi:hypothetical protein
MNKQLPLTALALMEAGVVDAMAHTLVYWAVKTREQSSDYSEIEASAELLASTRTQLLQLISASFSPDSDYTAPTVSNRPDRYDDYAHLTRRAEWGA